MPAQSSNRSYLLQSLSHLAVDKAKTEGKLAEAIDTSHEILFAAKTIFPFTLFPDTVSIDRTNITFTHRVFFRVATMVTIKIKDILNISPNVGPFFGSLRITTVFVDEESPYHVNYLWRRDALKISRLVHGYKVAMEKKIDTTQMSKDKLVGLLDELSRDGTEV